MKRKARKKKAPRRKMGRPGILTDELRETIATAVRGGNYIEVAAGYAGINKDTLFDWLRRGAREKRRVDNSDDHRVRIRTSEQRYVEFSDTMLKAEAEAEMRDVLLIGEAAKTQWQAAAWRLERKKPKKWGRTSRHELLSADGEAVKVEHAFSPADPVMVDLAVQMLERQAALLAESEADALVALPKPESPSGNGKVIDGDELLKIE